MINKSYVFRFKGEFYNVPSEPFITIFLKDVKSQTGSKAYKIAKSNILFYVPAKKSENDEILITLTDDEIKILKFPKFKNLRLGTKGTEGLPPKVIGVPPKLEFLVEGFEVSSIR